MGQTSIIAPSAGPAVFRHPHGNADAGFHLLSKYYFGFLQSSLKLASVFCVLFVFFLIWSMPISSSNNIFVNTAPPLGNTFHPIHPLILILLSGDQSVLAHQEGEILHVLLSLPFVNRCAAPGCMRCRTASPAQSPPAPCSFHTAEPWWPVGV